MTRPTFYKTLGGCTVTAIAALLGLYTALGGNPLYRLPFAVLAAAIPVLPVLIGKRWLRSRKGVVAAYVIAFMVVQVLWSWMRMI
jgi:4-amino-4-deoxy-L-arabinose transferase-like glycosyltransferase